MTGRTCKHVDSSSYPAGCTNIFSGPACKATAVRNGRGGQKEETTQVLKSVVPQLRALILVVVVDRRGVVEQADPLVKG